MEQAQHRTDRTILSDLSAFTGVVIVLGVLVAVCARALPSAAQNQNPTLTLDRPAPAPAGAFSAPRQRVTTDLFIYVVGSEAQRDALLLWLEETSSAGRPAPEDYVIIGPDNIDRTIAELENTNSAKQGSRPGSVRIIDLR